MRFALAVCFAILGGSPALADLDGHLLHRMCEARNMEFVSGFVVGVTDKAAWDAAFVASMVVEKADTNKTGAQLRTQGLKAMRAVQPFCIPRNSKLGDMAEFVCKSLELLPEARKHKAAALVADVLKVKYPCGIEAPPALIGPEDFINRPKAD